MKSNIDHEIESIDREIATLGRIRTTLEALRSSGEANGGEPKPKRGRKKKAGLPTAETTASEANHGSGKTEGRL